MKTITTYWGEVVYIDDEDFEQVSKRTWYVDVYGYAISSRYAGRDSNGKPKQDIVKLHRLVLKAAKGDIVDHINGNKLDCQKSNLRITDKVKNAWNRRPDFNNKTGYKGVTKAAYGNKWRAHIRNFYLGSFPSPEEAARAYNKAAIEEFGEFAYLNPV